MMILTPLLVLIIASYSCRQYARAYPIDGSYYALLRVNLGFERSSPVKGANRRSTLAALHRSLTANLLLGVSYPLSLR